MLLTMNFVSRCVCNLLRLFLFSVTNNTIKRAVAKSPTNDFDVAIAELLQLPLIVLIFFDFITLRSPLLSFPTLQRLLQK